CIDEISAMSRTTFDGTPTRRHEFWEWTDEGGSTIEAELVGYNYDTKTVKFRLVDGSYGETPLAKLNGRSQLNALFHPAFSESLRGSGWEMEGGWIALVVGSMIGAYFLLLVASILFGFFCYLVLAKYLVPEGEGYFRTFLIYSAFLIIGTTVITVAGAIISILGATLSLSFFEVLGGLCQFFGFYLVLFFAIRLVARRFDISWWRSLALMVGSQLVAQVLMFGIFVIAVVVIVAGSGGDPLAWMLRPLEPWVLKPLDLI
ncbi:MAG: hypothetical protein AAF357_14245, partial [Verrucomicrobiota bacterium]